MLNYNNLIYVYIGYDFPNKIIENSIFIPYLSFNSLSNNFKDELKNNLKYVIYTDNTIVKDQLNQDYNVNLIEDPFEEFEDVDIWQALEEVCY